MKISSSNISDVCNGKNRTAKGYYWKYIEKQKNPEDYIEI